MPSKRKYSGPALPHEVKQHRHKVSKAVLSEDAILIYGSPRHIHVIPGGRLLAEYGAPDHKHEVIQDR
jgi:hypothetical protein